MSPDEWLLCLSLVLKIRPLHVLTYLRAADGDVPYRPTAEAADAGQVEEDEDDDAIAARRARIRERLRARPTQQPEVLEVEHEEVTK